MAKFEATIRITDIERFRLFLKELEQIADRMLVEGCPHRDALKHALDRVVVQSGDRPEEPPA